MKKHTKRFRQPMLDFRDYDGIMRQENVALNVAFKAYLSSKPGTPEEKAALRECYHHGVDFFKAVFGLICQRDEMGWLLATSPTANS